jgi:hypothetical protein
MVTTPVLVAHARAILLVSCKISAFPFPKFLDAGGDSPGDIFGGLFFASAKQKQPLAKASIKGLRVRDGRYSEPELKRAGV